MSLWPATDNENVAGQTQITLWAGTLTLLKNYL